MQELRAIVGQMQAIERLHAREIADMFHLMHRHYERCTKSDFIQDLSEKDLALLLRDEKGKIIGFSTQMILLSSCQERPALVVFSGDTIIAKEFWGSITLPILFGQMMLKIEKEYPHIPLYWFLISKGVRTYRFLPTFFYQYYPHHLIETPAWAKEFMDNLASAKYPRQYEPRTGIIKAHEESQYLRHDIEDATRQEKKSPIAKFFYERNPGFANGDELVCLAPFHKQNLKPYILKVLLEKEYLKEASSWQPTLNKIKCNSTVSSTSLQA